MHLYEQYYLTVLVCTKKKLFTSVSVGSGEYFLRRFVAQ